MDKEKVNEIVQKLIQADEAYYNTGHSIMEDQEYDSLRAFVKQYEPDHPYFERVGNKPSPLWKKATHEIPMGSLEKVHTEEEFLKWAGKFGEDEVFISQPKVDGLSLEQLFDQGQYVQAITRGDGLVGEDITPNVALMNGFRTPELIINEFFHSDVDLKTAPYSTRCEVVLPKKDLERINSTIPEKKDQYKNCRNASSGISRRLDGKFCKYLSLKYYDILLSVPLDENEKMDVLKGMLLPTVPYYLGNVGHMVLLYNKLKETRESLPYGIDGMVIKINSWKKQQELGVVKGRPKSQIAWKFDPPSAATILLAVTWEVGRTGVITPLGHVEPVEIDGSIISRVTLHNIAQIARLRIGVGDMVMLVKAGDVIPYIESVLEHKNVPIEIPTHCPACKTELINDGIRLMCPGDSCIGKNFQRILNFIKVIKIDSFGESLAEKLYEQGKLTNLSDVFALKKEDISSIEGWGNKSAETIIANINGLKKMDPAIFLSALGIPSLSTSTAEDMWKKYGAIDAIRKASVEDICTIKGYSIISATKIVEGLKIFDDQMMKVLEHVELLDTSKGGVFSGMAFCFTGEMSHPRSYFQGIVTKLGGKNDSTITKATTFLVCNENKGSSKSRKAEQYEVKIINEAQFLEMVGEVPEIEKKPKLVLKSLFEE